MFYVPCTTLKDVGIGIYAYYIPLYTEHRIPMYICRTVPSAIYTNTCDILLSLLLFFNAIYYIIYVFDVCFLSRRHTIGPLSSLHMGTYLRACVKCLNKPLFGSILHIIIPVRRFLFGFVVETYKIFYKPEAYFVVPLRRVHIHTYILNNFTYIPTPRARADCRFLLNYTYKYKGIHILYAIHTHHSSANIIRIDITKYKIYSKQNDEFITCVIIIIIICIGIYYTM